MIVEVSASKLGDFAVNCSTEEACRRCGITCETCRDKAVGASEVLVAGVPEAALTKRVWCINPRSELGKYIVHEIKPNDQELDDSGAVVDFGSFREWVKQLEGVYPTEEEQDRVVAMLEVRAAASGARLRLPK
jgi:hypothetical protein